MKKPFLHARFERRFQGFVTFFFPGGDKKASEEALKEPLKRSKTLKLIFEEADWAEY